MRKVRIRRFKQSQWEETLDEVAEEGLLELHIEDGPKLAFVCTPADIQTLVLGHLLSQGFVRKREEVLEYQEEWDLSVGIPGEVARAKVRLAKRPSKSENKMFWSSCTENTPSFLDLNPLSPRPLFRPADLLSIPCKINEHIRSFRLTGAYHYAFIFDKSLGIVAVGEDIGRHNAVDKAIGKAFLLDQPLGETLLFTTGRVTAEMVAKALRAGVPLLVSQGAALLGAIHLARTYNLGLIGFLRGRRFNLYTGEGWLKP